MIMTLFEWRQRLFRRFVCKFHVIPSGLPPGDYYDVDTRMLHGCFSLLVDYVECDAAWMHVVFDEAARKCYRMPWWQFNRWIRWKRWRCANAGMAHLQWMSLHSHEPNAAAKYAKLTDLYLWWVNLRPTRTYPDPLPDGIAGALAILDADLKYLAEDQHQLTELISLRHLLIT